MEEQVIQHELARVHIHGMPRREDCRVRFELVDHICALFSRERVSFAHVTQIKEDQHLFDIWRTFPHDMTTLMHHVVGALMLIRRL